MHLRRVNDDIVLAVRVFWVDAEGVQLAYEFSVGCAELAVGAWVAEIPLPLLPHDFELCGFFRRSHKICPYKKTGCEHRDNTYSGDRRQPALKFVVLWLINRFVTWLLTEFVNTVGQEEVA